MTRGFPFLTAVQRTRPDFGEEVDYLTATAGNWPRRTLYKSVPPAAWRRGKSAALEKVRAIRPAG
jgi:hypothetical protein